MKQLAVFYGIAGGVLSFTVFLILQNLFRAADVQGFILVGTIVLSMTICCCTGILIATFQGKDINKKK
ncbi:MAG: hypothetical protein F8N39_01215 [Clostridiaceae bacterium]|nr:hypothetical protein [Clostridiaceae bacterium]